LGRREEVVFYGIPRSEHPAVLESRDLTEGLELDFLRKGG
jgi:hypothetical protein